MWFRGDECNLVAINVVSFAANVVSRSPIESPNAVEKSRQVQFGRSISASRYI